MESTSQLNFPQRTDLGHRPFRSRYFPRLESKLFNRLVKMVDEVHHRICGSESLKLREFYGRIYGIKLTYAREQLLLELKRHHSCNVDTIRRTAELRLCKILKLRELVGISVQPHALIGYGDGNLRPVTRL